MGLKNNTLKSGTTFFLAIIATLTATCAHAAKAEGGLQNISQPLSVNVVGNMILALGRDGRLWWRSVDSPTKWQPILNYKDGRPIHAERYICAADNSAFCIVDIKDSGDFTTLAVDAPNTITHTQNIKAKDIVLLPDKNNIYYESLRRDGSREIHHRYLNEGRDVVAAVIGPEDSPNFIPTRGNVYIYFLEKLAITFIEWIR